MAYYYINADEQASGQHEMHTEGCSHPPDIGNRRGVGYYDYCWSAMAAARAAYPFWNIDGCYYCCNACNTG